MNLLRSTFPVMVLCGAVTACATPDRAAPGPLALTPTEQFAIEVHSTADEIQLAPHGVLSPAQEAALTDLASRWRDAGEGPIIIHAAAGGPAGGTAHAAAHALQAAGVPGPMTQVVRYDEPTGVPPSPVRVGFSRLVAVGPQCANLWGNLARSASNLPPPSFGCAVTANMAAQIANPRDLVTPRSSYPADAVRRATVLDKYRKGEPTGTARGEDESGDISAASK